MSTNILGVKVDNVTLTQAADQVESWLKEDNRHYIVTPNPEIIIAAQSDSDFKKVLNYADLSIPDSPRLNWATNVLNSKGLSRFSAWLLFLFPQLLASKALPTTTGTDLMERLITQSEEKGFTVGFLGGYKKVAIKLSERLLKKHPKLKIAISTGNIKVDTNGQGAFELFYNEMIRSKDIKADIGVNSAEDLQKKLTQKMDILFVGFGHIKQEKWISGNLPKLNTKVMIGVGGALDYLSGEIPRAPGWLRSLGLEWLFRLLTQPWRITRFGALIKFVYLVAFGSVKT